MPKKKQDKKHPKYTKVFSNIANPFYEPEFIQDDWDPYDEAKSLGKGKTIKHALSDFEFGLHDIKTSQYVLRQFVRRYPYARRLIEVDDEDTETLEKLKFI